MAKVAILWVLEHMGFLSKSRDQRMESKDYIEIIYLINCGR